MSNRSTIPFSHVYPFCFCCHYSFVSEVLGRLHSSQPKARRALDRRSQNQPHRKPAKKKSYRSSWRRRNSSGCHPGQRRLSWHVHWPRPMPFKTYEISVITSASRPTMRHLCYRFLPRNVSTYSEAFYMMKIQTKDCENSIFSIPMIAAKLYSLLHPVYFPKNLPRFMVIPTALLCRITDPPGGVSLNQNWVLENMWHLHPTLRPRTWRHPKLRRSTRYRHSPTAIELRSVARRFTHLTAIVGTVSVSISNEGAKQSRDRGHRMCVMRRIVTADERVSRSLLGPGRPTKCRVIGGNTRSPRS
jgi:hypothetical protein